MCIVFHLSITNKYKYLYVISLFLFFIINTVRGPRWLAVALINTTGIDTPIGEITGVSIGIGDLPSVLWPRGDPGHPSHPTHPGSQSMTSQDVTSYEYLNFDLIIFMSCDQEIHLSASLRWAWLDVVMLFLPEVRRVQRLLDRF